MLTDISVFYHNKVILAGIPVASFIVPIWTKAAPIIPKESPMEIDSLVTEYLTTPNRKSGEMSKKITMITQLMVFTGSR